MLRDQPRLRKDWLLLDSSQIPCELSSSYSFKKTKSGCRWFAQILRLQYAL